MTDDSTVESTVNGFTPPARVSIHTITNSDVHANHLGARIATHVSGPQPNYQIVYDEIRGCGPYLDDGRNKCVESFLAQKEADWLLFIDSDISWTVDDLNGLFNLAHPTDAPIIGGAYMSVRSQEARLQHQNPLFVVAYNRTQTPNGTNNGTNWEYKALTPSELFNLEGPIVSVDAIGAGFLAIHRGVLTTMQSHFNLPTPWFFEPNVQNGNKTVHLGEDLGFCARAKSLGYDIHLATTVRLTHHKTVDLTLEAEWLNL